MRYRAAVYYHGPKTQWSGKIDAAEIIFDQAVPWLWLARARARQALGNTGRCGYVIKAGDELLEHVTPIAPAYGDA